MRPSVTFALDGRDYGIDLSAASAQRLGKALGAFVAASRKATDMGRRKRTRTARSSGGDVAEPTAIRAWAQKHGHQASDRGRISAQLREL